MAVSPNKAGNMEGNINNNSVILLSVFTGGIQITLFKSMHLSNLFFFLAPFSYQFPRASDLKILFFFC